MDDRERLARDTLNEFMRVQGKRQTRQREVIVDAFIRAKDHMTLQQLLTRSQVVEPSIGFATVYRTMKLLVEAGVAEEHRFGEGQSRYELADVDGEHHDHLICVRCGRIEEFEDHEIERRQAKVASTLGWSVTHHVHEIYGVCPTCQEQQA
jgi:Fur family transcriptional regulator, ferric uptake regulator